MFKTPDRLDTLTKGSGQDPSWGGHPSRGDHGTWHTGEGGQERREGPSTRQRGHQRTQIQISWSQPMPEHGASPHFHHSEKKHCRCISTTREPGCLSSTWILSLQPSFNQCWCLVPWMVYFLPFYINFSIKPCIKHVSVLGQLWWKNIFHGPLKLFPPACHLKKRKKKRKERESLKTEIHWKRWWKIVCAKFLLETKAEALRHTIVCD